MTPPPTTRREAFTTAGLALLGASLATSTLARERGISQESIGGINGVTTID